MIVNVFVDGATEARLRVLAKETARSIDDLCDSAISEAVLDAFRDRDDDPGHTAKQDQPL